MATNDERHAAHLLTLLAQAPGRQLSSAQLAEQTGWSPEELSAAVGILRGRQQVVLDDVWSAKNSSCHPHKVCLITCGPGLFSR
jgi:hypothetical protein